jgi:hypothetical protein
MSCVALVEDSNRPVTSWSSFSAKAVRPEMELNVRLSASLVSVWSKVSASFVSVRSNVRSKVSASPISVQSEVTSARIAPRVNISDSSSDVIC